MIGKRVRARKGTANGNDITEGPRRRAVPHRA
jgi:hypothetical protein